jgi:NAD-dependent dihydropyrimidine dehydrogenase PreA subunit
MIKINYLDCTGCGECIQYCPSDAILLQNNVATIDQERCDECMACIEACPQGAIIIEPTKQEEIKTVVISENTPEEISAQPPRTISNPLSTPILPILGSFLIWMGKEIVPRLTMKLINNMDVHIKSPDQTSEFSDVQTNKSRTIKTGGGRHRRQRKRKQRQSINKHFNTTRKENKNARW